MANKRSSIRDYGKKDYYTRRDNYINGNTVRKLNTVPERREVPQEEKKVSRKTSRNRERAMEMNMGYVFFLTIAAVASLFVCIQYLKLQSDVTQQGKNLTAMESELETLKESNDTAYNEIVDSVDLTHVRRVAMEELGMIEADLNQIIPFEHQEDDYTRQYEDVPKDGNVK